MRVLHLSAGNLYGGIERLLVTLAQERGHCPEMEPHFGLCFDGRVARELREAGVPVHLLGGVRFSRPWTVWRARRALRELLRRERYDVVITHACWPHALFAAATRAVGAPLVFWAHDRPTGTHWSERRASRTRPDLVIANSRYTQDATGIIFPEVSAVVHYCPVPLSRRNRDDRGGLRAQLGVGADHVVIVVASRMEPWKGHHVLLSALARLKDQLGWRCWVVGGAQRPSEEAHEKLVRKMSQELQLDDRVRFLGQRSDVPALLADADIHCQPNTSGEPFGIAFIEALACGARVLASDIPVLREVGGAAAVYAPVGDIGGWAEKATVLLRDIEAGPPKSARLQWASRYSWTSHAQTVWGAYAKLLQKS